MISLARRLALQQEIAELFADDRELDGSDATRAGLSIRSDVPARRAARLAAGLCPDCGSQRDRSDRLYCHACRERYRVRDAIRWEQNATRHPCELCGAPAARKFCAPCRPAARKAAAARKEARRRARRGYQQRPCVDCGAPTVARALRCYPHREAHRLAELRRRAAERTALHRAAGLCLVCRLPTDGQVRHQACRRKREPDRRCACGAELSVRARQYCPACARQRERDKARERYRASRAQ